MPGTVLSTKIMVNARYSACSLVELVEYGKEIEKKVKLVIEWKVLDAMSRVPK